MPDNMTVPGRVYDVETTVPGSPMERLRAEAERLRAELDGMRTRHRAVSRALLGLLDGQPTRCHYHGGDFERAGMWRNQPRCESCRIPYATCMAIDVLNRDVRGQPSVAWEQGRECGHREAEQLAAINDPDAVTTEGAST